MSWHDLLPVAVFLVTFFASILSGIVGGGGGFIMTPFYILIGLTPQQTVATGKFSSFGLTTGAIIAFKKRMLKNRRLSVLIMLLAVVVGLSASLLVVRVNNEVLQRLMGIFMLIMVPFMLVGKNGLSKANPSTTVQTIGWIFLTLILFLQGILGGGIGAMVSVVFILCFGTTALEANVLKRTSSLILNLTIVLSLLHTNLINYKYGLAGMAGGLLGGYAGSHIAIKKGDEFAKNALLVFMVVSGIWLIATA